MKCFLCAAIVIGFSATYLLGRTNDAQHGQPSQTQIALIDMAHVFNNSNKFNALRDDLKGDISQTDQEMQRLNTKATIVSGELAKLDRETPEAKEKQRELESLKQDANTLRTESIRRFQTTEAGYYRQIYLELSDVVREIAQERKLSMVIRFDGRPMEEITKAEDLLRSMNRIVIYTEEGNDITDEVLKRHNENYKKAAE